MSDRASESGNGAAPPAGARPGCDAPPFLETVPACLACGATTWRKEVEVEAQMHPAADTFTFVRCAECGLVFLNPRVPSTALGPYYTDAYLPYRGPEAWGVFAPAVAAGLAWTDQKRVARVRAVAGPLRPGSRVLDVGCGRPTFLDRMVRATGATGIGVDFSDAGWRDEPDRWRGLDLRVGEVDRLTLEEPADVVTMWHYLEHDYHPRATLRNVRRFAPAGRLVIEVPDHDAWTRHLHGRWWSGYHAPRHTALYTPETLRTLLESSGWRVELLETRGSLDPYLIHWMSRMERRGIDWSDGLAARFPGFLVGKLLTAPRFALRPRGGLLTAVARPA